jgi:hypothetical protein
MDGLTGESGAAVDFTPPAATFDGKDCRLGTLFLIGDRFALPAGSGLAGCRGCE